MVKLKAVVKLVLQLIYDFLQRGVSRFTFGWSDTCVCVGGCVLPRCLRCATLIWNAWQCFTAPVCFDYFSFFLIFPRSIFRGMILAPPHHFLSRSRSLSFRSFCSIHHHLHCCSCAVRSISRQMSLVVLCVCLASCWFRRGLFAHADGSFTLCHTLCVCVRVCVCVFFTVFPRGLAPPASFCISPLSIVLSLSLRPSRPPRPPLYDVYWTWWAANLFWLVSGCSWCLWFACLAPLLVMWCALDWLRVICVWNSVVWFCLFCFLLLLFNCFQLMILLLKSPFLPLFFLRKIKCIIFECPCFLEYILFLLVLFFCADGCIVCAQNCLTTLLYPWF